MLHLNFYITVLLLIVDKVAELSLVRQIYNSRLCVATCYARCKDLNFKPAYYRPLLRCQSQCRTLESHTCQTDFTKCQEKCVTEVRRIIPDPNCKELCKDPYLPNKPSPLISIKDNPYLVLVEWDESYTYNHNYYIVENLNVEKCAGSTCRWKHIETTSNTTSYVYMDVCESRKIRVASVNQHGTRGYSNPILRTNFPRPKVSLLVNSFAARFDGYYFHVNASWTTPLEWNEKDIIDYTVNPQVAKYCEHTTLPPVPIVERRNKFTADIRIFISGFGCLYYFNVTAISRCGVKGVPAVFTVKLQCKSISGFECPTEKPKQPPKVRNLTITTLTGFNNVRVSWKLPIWNDSRPDYYFLIWGPSENFISPDYIENTKLMNDTNLTDVFETDIHVHNLTQLYLIGVAPRVGKVIKDPAELRNSQIAFSNFLVGQTDDVGSSSKATITTGALIGVILGITITISIPVIIGLATIRKKLKEKHRKRSNFSPNPFYYKCNETSDSPKPDAWEVSRNDLQISEILGEGNFGKVARGTLNGREKPVAVKMLLEYSSVHRSDFLREIQVMKQVGEHENIINMIGCITTSEPPCLIFEHMPKGDLYHYLQNAKAENNLISLDKLLNFSIQIATAMNFLSSKGFVHRDLAARNILLDEGDKVKVGDFGLARFIQDDRIYVCRKGSKLPVKWMAIESIFDLSFSSQSDIWSFGIVLYELITHGSTPYPSFSNEELLPCLKAGYRMPKPIECPERLYQIMILCWTAIPNRRPSFEKLKNDLEEMLS